MKSRFFFAVLIFTLLFTIQISAKDNWINVRSKNFFLIGNASEKDIRGVATKLEQFRETFRLLFPKVKFSQSIQTNVVVFKNKSAYKPFLPKRADGKADEGIAGYFQSGEDVNYITISMDGEKKDTYETIFHEYVHFMVNTNFGRSEIPPWFNEGLAEYYSTFSIENDQKVLLGDIQSNHLYSLQQNQLIPLKTFFEIDNYSLHQNGNHSRSIFYSQAWALIHYLIQGNKGANNAAMNKFLGLILDKVEPEKAFQQAFQYDYATMEKALKSYVSQSQYQISVITFQKKLVFDSEMTTVPMQESEANAYLGDLLYHTHEEADAEVYLNKSLALDANSIVANTSLGLVKMKQRKFAEAKKYLETAIANDPKNYFTQYNYAYILSRESMDEFGYVRKYSSDSANKMRELLNKAIEIKPEFPESYRLLAFVNVVNNEKLDESLALLKKGLSYQAGNEQYQFLIAQIYMRQEKFAEARKLAESLIKNADEPSIRANAQNLLKTITQNEEIRAENERRRKEYEQQITQNGKNGEVVIVRNKREKPLTEAEWAKINEENENNEVNRGIERPKTGETQVVGFIEKITCVKGVVNYGVKTETGLLNLTSKDFNELKMINFSTENENAQIGCDTSLKNLLTVLTYQENKNAKIKSNGTLSAIYFVPKTFKLKTVEEMASLKDVRVINEIETPPEAIEAENSNFEKDRNKAMTQAIREALRKPEAGEKREQGIAERIECSGNKILFVVKIGGESIKLKAKSPQDVKIAILTATGDGMQIGCGVKFPPIPAIITYRQNGKEGEIVAIEFVPESFKLEN
jgi:Protein of unknown function (DUF1570)